MKNPSPIWIEDKQNDVNIDNTSRFWTNQYLLKTRKNPNITSEESFEYIVLMNDDHKYMEVPVILLLTKKDCQNISEFC